MSRWFSKETSFIVTVALILLVAFIIGKIGKDIEEATGQIEYVTEVAEAAIDTTVKVVRYAFENLDTAAVNGTFREYAESAREFKDGIKNAVREKLQKTGGESVTITGWRVLRFPGTIGEDEIKRRIAVMDWSNVAVPDGIEIISIYTIATLGGKAAE
jgi:hypothetical protein